MQTKFLGSLFVALAFATTATLAANPLHEAAKNGDKASIRRFLADTNCNIEDRDDFGRTPLILAAEYGHLNCIKILTSCGADIKKNGTTALHAAAKNGHTSCVDYLKAKITADCAAKNPYGNTPQELDGEYLFGYESYLFDDEAF
ncbi:ankyrin repeat domain-containing protein [bacterium]|nr:MAG: ankyrin repeat domain-containing protein [bacterium]